MTNPNRFYVYAYLREDGTPYYIGKGCGRRISEKHNVKVPPKSRRIKLIWDVSEGQAFKYERLAVKFYGCKHNGTGILRNMTDGGEGVSGYRHTAKAKAKFSLRRNSEESNAKRSAAQAGRPHAAIHAAKLAAANKANASTRQAKSAQNRRINTAKRLNVCPLLWGTLDSKQMAKARMRVHRGATGAAVFEGFFAAA